MTKQVSEIFDSTIWHEVPGFDALEDITYHKHNELGIAVSYTHLTLPTICSV